MNSCRGVTLKPERNRAIDLAVGQGRRTVTVSRPFLGSIQSQENGAAWVTRTPDPRITNAMLYQLS